MTEKAPKVFPTEAELKVLVADELAKLEGLNVNDSHNLRQIYSCIDLTSLNSTDGPNSIEAWLDKALFGVAFKPAAICVYSNFSRLVHTKLKGTGVKTAVVSTSFPTGQTF